MSLVAMPRENTLDKRLPRIGNLKGGGWNIVVPVGSGATFGGSPLRNGDVNEDALTPSALPLNLSCESLVLEASNLALKKFHPALGLACLG